MKPALDIVRKSLASLGHDVAIICHLPHIRRITGFTGSNALLFVSSHKSILFTDGRYTEQASRQVSNADVRIGNGALLETVLQQPLLKTVKALAVQGEYQTAEDFARIASSVESVGGSAVLTKGWLQALFASKTSSEIESIAKAQSITDRVFAEIHRMLDTGVSEKDLASEIVYLHLQGGAERMSFDPIVAFGENSALPHARPTSRQLRSNEPILIDMGCFVDGYASDMTRNIYYGTPTAEYLNVYGIVNNARANAIDSVKAGVSCRALDEIARDHVTESGFGDKFVHSLGHGVGLEVHEYPTISARSTAVLEKGMVITIEPGIYLDNSFGIRVEDLVVVDASGHRVLTQSASELKVVEL